MTMTAESPTDADERLAHAAASRPDRSDRSRPSLAYAAKLARKELWRRRGRATLVVLLVVVPTWIMINMVTYVRSSDVAHNNGGPDFTSDLVIPFGDPAKAADERATAASSPEVSITGALATTPQSQIEAALPAGSTFQPLFGGYTSIMSDDGAIERARFVKVDLTTDAAKTWAPVDKGRAANIGEVVLGDDLAKRLGVDVGDTVTLREPDESWVVSGTTSWYQYDLFAVGEQDETELVVNAGALLVNLPPSATAEEANRLAEEFSGFTPTNSRFFPDISSDYDDEFEPVAITLLLALMVFIMFGVVIVGAFATIARGQLVTVGQLAANGAKRPFIARTLALQGSWAGLVGVGIGFVATLATFPLISRIAPFVLGAPVDRLAWSPFDFVIIGVIGVAVATAAAAVPSLSLTRVSPLAALAGRRPERPVPKWMVPVGVASSGLGLLLLTMSVKSSTTEGAAGSILGAIAMVIGVCLVGPLAIQSASRAAGVMPLSVRISLRGLGRSRLRSAAVVSSIAVTTGVMAVVVAGAQTNLRGPLPGEMANNVAFAATFPSAVLRTPDGEALLDQNGMPLYDLPSDFDKVELSWLPTEPTAQLDQIRAALPDATEHAIRVALRPDGVYDRDQVFIPQLAESEADVVYSFPPAEFMAPPLIADKAILAGLSLPDTFLDDLDDVGYATAVTSRQCPGDSDTWTDEQVELTSVEPDGFTPGTAETIAVAGLECWRSIGPFMTEQYATNHGYQVEPAGVVFVNPGPLTESERNALVNRYEYASLFADWDYAGVPYLPQPAAESSVVAHAFSTIPPGIGVFIPLIDASDFALMQLIVGIGAVIVVTVITGMGLALAASDSRRDRAVLSVIGAKPKTQRRVAATDALVLVVIGTVLGVPAALFAARVVTASAYQGRPTGVPWSFVAAEFVLVPLVVAGFAYVAGWVRRPNPPMRVLHTD